MLTQEYINKKIDEATQNFQVDNNDLIGFKPEELKNVLRPDSVINIVNI